MKIMVVGAGTLGGNILEHLARQDSQGLWTLGVVDQDRVELRNLINQPYLRQQVGKSKAACLADLLHRIHGHPLQAEHKTLTPANATRLLQGWDLVLDCLDNHAGRSAVQQGCRSQGLACLHLGLASDYLELIWDEHYRVPPDAEVDPCAQPLGRSLAVLAVGLLDKVLGAFRQGQRINLCMTTGDLAVSCPVGATSAPAVPSESLRFDLVGSAPIPVGKEH